MRIRNKVAVDNGVGMVKRIAKLDGDNKIKVVFLDGAEAWYPEVRVTVLSDGQVQAVERRFGRGAWAAIEKESKVW